MQIENTANLHTRRIFLKRIAIGAAALTTAALAFSKVKADQPSADSLPDADSIFAPRQQDVRKYWTGKLSSFRLR